MMKHLVSYLPAHTRCRFIRGSINHSPHHLFISQTDRESVHQSVHQSICQSVHQKVAEVHSLTHLRLSRSSLMISESLLLGFGLHTSSPSSSSPSSSSASFFDEPSPLFSLTVSFSFFSLLPFFSIFLTLFSSSACGVNIKEKTILSFFSFSKYDSVVSLNQTRNDCLLGIKLQVHSMLYRWKLDEFK